MKTSLIIDGNYLLYKDMFILFQEKILYSELENLLKKDLNTLIKMFTYDTIYFVSDSKMRWRQSFYNEYKQNRKPDEKIDWEFVYGVYDEFKEYIKSLNNIHFYQIDYAEGDDLIAYIVKENNKKGISNIIMASDGDLHQLINFDLGSEYINVMYNYKISDERTYWPRNYNIFIQEMSQNINSNLFDMNEDSDFISFLEELIKRTKTKEVSPEETLFCKMVSGDRKDNVPSVYIKGSRGIGETGSMSIYNLYKETIKEEIDFDSDEFIDKLTDIISFNKKIADDITKNEIRSNLHRNRKLLRLDENYLPSQLKSQILREVKIY